MAPAGDNPSVVQASMLRDLPDVEEAGAQGGSEGD